MVIYPIIIMGRLRELQLDFQEAWLVAIGRIARGLRRLSPSALREKALELNSRPARRQAAQMHIVRQDFQEHPERYPFFSASTQPLDKSRQPLEQ